MSEYATERVAKHSSRLQPSINLHAPLPQLQPLCSAVLVLIYRICGGGLMVLCCCWHWWIFGRWRLLWGCLSYIVNMIAFMRMPVAVVTVGGHVATSLPMRLWSMHVPELLLLVLCALCSSSIVITTLDCGVWSGPGDPWFKSERV